MINKSSQLKISIQEKIVKHELAVLIENNNDYSYEGYFRILVPSSSGFSEATFITNGTKEEVAPNIVGLFGRKEAGIAINLEPDEKKVLVFSWDTESDLDLEKDGNYSLYWQKQIGAKNQNASIIFSIPENLAIEKADDNYFLTQEGEYGYNISLSRDIVSRIFWKR
jgi:hypothetical protein